MFLFLWNFILRALYINKLFSSWWNALRGREKSVISNVLPFAKEQMVFVCGASRKFYTLKLTALFHVVLREISVFSSSGASQVVSHLMSLCSKASRGMELHWPTLYNGDCSQVQARVACLKFVLCSTLARQAQGDTEWSQVSASLFVPCVKTWLFRSSDFHEPLQLWEADGEQSPGDTS